MTPLALLRRYLHNVFVTANSVTRFDDLTVTADNRLSAVFFRPSFAIGAPSFRRAVAGSLRAAGFRNAGSSTLPFARHPFDDGAGINCYGGIYHV